MPVSGQLTPESMGDTFQDHQCLKPWTVQHPMGAMTITVALALSARVKIISYALAPPYITTLVF